ncbi:MAG: hypothetical protein ACP6IU_01815 [Candidatus Asgardarchaeia archaeon]
MCLHESRVNIRFKIDDRFFSPLTFSQVPIWPILEERLERIYGRPKDEIEEFVRTMEYSETYSGFLEQSPNTFKVEKFNLVEKV